MQLNLPMAEFFSEINTLISSQQSALIAGVIAAFTPCILALIPLFLYRFGVWGNDGKKRKRSIVGEIGLLMLGYFISFTLSGIVFQQLSNSTFVNATRLTLGTLLFMIGVLQLFGFLSVQVINKFSNPLAIGLVLPFVISFSPCVLPYFSTLLAGSISADSVFNFWLFGLGVLIPAIIISIFGKFALNLFRRTNGWLHKIERISGLLIVFSGLYLASQLVQITQVDVDIAAGALMLTFAWQMWRQWQRKASHTLRNVRNIGISILTWSIGLGYLLSIVPSSDTSLSGSAFTYACTSGHSTCDVCNTVTGILAMIALVMAFTILTSTRPGKKFKLSI